MPSSGPPTALGTPLRLLTFTPSSVGRPYKADVSVVQQDFDGEPVATATAHEYEVPLRDKEGAGIGGTVDGPSRSATSTRMLTRTATAPSRLHSAGGGRNSRN